MDSREIVFPDDHGSTLRPLLSLRQISRVIAPAFCGNRQDAARLVPIHSHLRLLGITEETLLPYIARIRLWMNTVPGRQRSAAATQNGTRCSIKVNSWGNAPVIDVENVSNSNRRTQKTRIILDVLSLLITLACLGFALYRSWH